MGDDHPLRGAARLLDQVLALLVADPERRLGQPHVAVGRAAHAGGAHREVVDHRVRDVGHALEVVGGAGGDRAEHDLLGHASAEQHRHVVEQLLARLQVAVLGGQVERVAERLPARHDRDAVHAVDRRQQLAAQRMPGLVEGDHALLVRVQHASRLHAGDHALERRVEVRHRRSPSRRGGWRRSRPRCRCSRGRRRSARSSAGPPAPGRRSRAACRACARRARPRGLSRRAAPRTPGGRSGPGAAAPGRASRAGSRRRSPRRARSRRSRPSRRAAG